MKFLLLIVIAITMFGCQHAPIEKRLIGTWRSDPQRTLMELPQDDSKVLDKITKVIKWSTSKKCGSVKVVYEDNVYRTILEGGSDVAAPYRIVKQGSDYVVIDQFNNGGITEIHFVKNGFYVNQEINGVVFKDYFTNIPCSDDLQKK